MTRPTDAYQVTVGEPPPADGGGGAGGGSTVQSVVCGDFIPLISCSLVGISIRDQYVVEAAFDLRRVSSLSTTLLLLLRSVAAAVAAAVETATRAVPKGNELQQESCMWSSFI